MVTFGITLAIALFAFVFFMLAILLSRLLGRKRPQRCACKAAKAVVREFENRERNALRAIRYRPDRVNPRSLPIISAESTENQGNQ